MLQVNDGSNSIIDFVFGRFSSSFSFSLISFIVFLLCFFHGILSLKMQYQFLFSLESQDNFFWGQNIHHFDQV